MKRFKPFLVISITALLALATVVSACSPASGSPAAATTGPVVVAVQRGDVTVDITSAGNLTFSVTAEPAFEIAGTVSEVLVDDAQPVKKGDVLARLDKSEWEDKVSLLESALINAQRQLTSKQRAVVNSEISLKNAWLALEKAKEPTSSTGLNSTLGPDPIEIEIKEMQYQLARSNLDDAKLSVRDAEKGVRDAQKLYDEMKNASLEAIAPFDGFITKTIVTGGQEIKKGQVAANMADPTKFEARLFVGEMDIFKLAIGTPANVSIDAVAGLVVPAKVTKIAPTATIQSNVVNYDVKVELDATQVVQEQRTTQGTMSDSAREQIADRLRDLIQERRAQQGSASGEGGVGTGQGQGIFVRPGAGTGAAGTGSSNAAAPATSPATQLKHGMSVTVNIVAQERKNVLMVPNRAVVRQGRNTVVQIANTNPVEMRPVRVGLSNSQYTEIIDGLKEGEKVVVPQTTSGTSSSGQQPRQGGMFIQGMPVPGMGQR